MKRFLFLLLMVVVFAMGRGQNTQRLIDEVNPFIGTSNFGACHPGAVLPTGLMSVAPFNVMGSDLNAFDKDNRWWSTPYDKRNVFFTGFSHVNLSGVGCPDMGSLLLMPTVGALEVDYRKYGCTYTDEKAYPGYYSNRLENGVCTEVSATLRSAVARFTYPAGKGNVLLNLGEGLTNENGAWVRYVSATEIEGAKLLGTFCYNTPNAVYPLYFVMRVSKTPSKRGFWKRQRPMTTEAQWNPHAGRYKLYPDYRREMAGDEIGAYFEFETDSLKAVEVRIGISFVSTENARLNLDTEQPEGTTFEWVAQQAEYTWEDALSKVTIEGGTPDQRTIFYTALYHAQLHPNILQDVNGEYPMMKTGETRRTAGNRYTVFSLWDTYRCTHQLYTLLFPHRQQEMVRTMIDHYREQGWLPKWELYSQETYTMEGDPATPVIVDTWMKGLRDFDVELAYEAMKKGATTTGRDNPLRPDNDDYLALGFCALRDSFDNSVSHALEYYVADAALSKMACALGKTADAKCFAQRAKNYRHYYCPQFGTLRPKLPDGTFFSPFNPQQGANFEPSPGFHEGNAWNYTFFVPHDVKGLAKLMGGQKAFVEKLQAVFDAQHFDLTNEPDMAYPYLFSYFNNEAWRTQRLTRQCLEHHFRNAPDGLPGNDDAGTLSTWAVFAMMGFYPDNPADASYTLTAPVFEKITLHLDAQVHGTSTLTISAPRAGSSERIRSVRLGGRRYPHFRVSHSDLLKSGRLDFEME